MAGPGPQEAHDPAQVVRGAVLVERPDRLLAARDFGDPLRQAAIGATKLTTPVAMAFCGIAGNSASSGS